jgi:hypothetical protein
MWEPQLLATLRSSTACIMIALPAIKIIQHQEDRRTASEMAMKRRVSDCVCLSATHRSDSEWVVMWFEAGHRFWGTKHNIVLLIFSKSKNPVILSVTHHRQNSLESARQNRIKYLKIFITFIQENSLGVTSQKADLGSYAMLPLK